MQMKSMVRIQRVGKNLSTQKEKSRSAYEAMLAEDIKSAKPKKETRSKKKVYKKITEGDLKKLEFLSKQYNTPMKELKQLFHKGGSVNKVADSVLASQK